MNSAGGAHELYFLYELAKALAASIDLTEVTEYALDGACALLGAEQGFIYFKDDVGALCVHAARELTDDNLRLLAEHLQPVLAGRQPAAVAHPSSDQGEALAAPLVARNQEQGVIGVATVYARHFTTQEIERISAVANLASLALENAHMHERAQRELAMSRRLIEVAQAMGAGEMTKEQAAEFESEFKDVIGQDQLSHLVRTFANMAQQVIEREEELKRQVAELHIKVDLTRKAKQVAEITETEYFQQLEKRARRLRGE
jgi:GAF domain-containing protein